MGLLTGCGEQGTVTMVNVGYDDKLSEYLAVEDLGLIPLYQGSKTPAFATLPTATDVVLAKQR